MTRDIDESSENVREEWSRHAADEGTAEDDHTERAAGASPYGAVAQAPDDAERAAESWAPDLAQDEAQGEVVETEVEGAEVAPGETEDEAYADASDAAIAVEPSQEHAFGELEIPDGYAVLEGYPDGSRRAVGVVVARFNGGVTSRLLDRALEELDKATVPREAITVMVVPGAFELPIAATALAKTRRFACIVALGCVIRGDTPHFDYVASEAASGLQLAALETGVPVSFGVLTLDRVEQAEPRVEKGAEAVRTALEMADVFSHLRAAASR